MALDNILANALDIGKTIGDQTQARLNYGIQKQAGNVLATGDYGGAANVLNQAGLIDQGQKVQQYGQSNTTYGQGQTDRSNTIAGATAFGGGNYAAATQAFAKTPDLNNVQASVNAGQADRQKQVDNVSKALDYLDNAVKTQGPQAADTAWRALDPNVLGVKDPNVWAQMHQAFVANPQGFITSVRAAATPVKGEVVPDDATLKNPVSGVIIGAPGTPKPLIIPKDAGLFQPGAPAPAAGPAPTQPLTAPATAPAAGAPRNQRNNNPGNIEDGPFAQSLPGYAGTDGRFAKFTDPGAGTQAQMALLKSYGGRGIDTVAGIINRWAPPSDGNDTSAYVASVAKQLGVQPGQKLDMTDPVVLSDLAAAIQRQEGGANSGTKDAAPLMGGPAQDTLAPPAGGRWLVKPTPEAPQWQPDGKGNLVNVKTGDRKVDPTASIDPASADPKVVQMVIDGRYPIPTGRAAADPKWQAVVAAAAAQDPTFNAADYATRAKTRQDFTSGKASANITALNTAIGHIDQLDKQVDGLNNSSIPALNKVGNWFASETGDPRIKAFDANKMAVADEVLRVFRQTGGSMTEAKDFQKLMDAADSPDQLHGVVQEMTKLLGSRLEALGTQYQQGLGKAADPIQFLNRKSQAAFTRITGIAPSGPAPDLGGVKAAAPAAPAAAAPVSATILAARQAIAKGAPRDAVIQRLRAHGVNPAGL